MLVGDDDGRTQRQGKYHSKVFETAEAISKRLLGDKATMLIAQTSSGIYYGRIIGETETHILQRLSGRIAVAHLKCLLDAVPNIGLEATIIYSRNSGKVREIRARAREKELSR
jgi:hypothetical protein